MDGGQINHELVSSEAGRNKMDYLKKAVELLKYVTERTGPGVYHVAVFHDEDCTALKGGPCRCNPDVELTKPPPWFTAVSN